MPNWSARLASQVEDTSESPDSGVLGEERAVLGDPRAELGDPCTPGCLQCCLKGGRDELSKAGGPRRNVLFYGSIWLFSRDLRARAP